MFTVKVGANVVIIGIAMMLLQLSCFCMAITQPSSSSTTTTQLCPSLLKQRHHYHSYNVNNYERKLGKCSIRTIISIRGGDGDHNGAGGDNENTSSSPTTSSMMDNEVDKESSGEEMSSTTTADPSPPSMTSETISSPSSSSSSSSSSETKMPPSPTVETIKSKIDLSSKIKELKDRRQKRQNQHHHPQQQQSSSASSSKKNPLQHLLLQSKNNDNNNPLLQTTKTHGQNVIFSMFFPQHNQQIQKSLLAVFSLSLLGTSIGFQSFLYFVTVGYAFAVFLVSSVLLLVYNTLSNHAIPKLTNLHTTLTFLWSVRLMIFLLYREYKNWPQLHKRIIQVNERSRMESKFSVWIMCSAFYTAMIMPCVYRMQQVSLMKNSESTSLSSSAPSESSWGVVGKIGISFQIIGLLLESIADAQKSSFKARNKGSNRSKWCHEGLWKYSTNPNFLGEGMFWLGTYLGGIGCCLKQGIMSTIICTVGLLFIIFVIRGAVESLRVKQWRNYVHQDDDEEFVEFQRTHGFFGPFRLSKQPMTGLSPSSSF